MFLYESFREPNQGLSYPGLFAIAGLQRDVALENHLAEGVNPCLDVRIILESLVPPYGRLNFGSFLRSGPAHV